MHEAGEAASEEDDGMLGEGWVEVDEDAMPEFEWSVPSSSSVAPSLGPESGRDSCTSKSTSEGKTPGKKRVSFNDPKAQTKTKTKAAVCASSVPKGGEGPSPFPIL